jgi:CubicO group peptidase (beta-lactamase class C family)
LRFSAGLMLGDDPVGIWGPQTRYAYGHAGLANKFAWADPQRDLSAAILTTGIPVVSHHLLPLANTLRCIANTFPILDPEPAPFSLPLH